MWSREARITTVSGYLAVWLPRDLVSLEAEAARVARVAFLSRSSRFEMQTLLDDANTPSYTSVLASIYTTVSSFFLRRVQQQVITVLCFVC